LASGTRSERYEEAFRDNDVDGDVLPDLTAKNLIGIGVTSIGHRRKLLATIAAIGPDVSAVATRPAPTETSAPAAKPGAAQTGAERRQLTVMFCDIVGPTALSTQLDPEDLLDLIDTYHRAVAQTAARFAGFVAKYMVSDDYRVRAGQALNARRQIRGFTDDTAFLRRTDADQITHYREASRHADPYSQCDST
jgi:SAM (Sterile alpha motif) domain-containing protein